MLKNVVVAACVCLLSTSLFAQSTAGSSDGFAPRKGDFEFLLVFGKGQFIGENTEYLLPAYNALSVGLPSSTNQSDAPASYLKLGSINNNSVMNMVGMQGKYFFTDHLEVNLLLSMNVNHTPKVDYGEGDMSVADMPIPSYKWVEGVYANNYLTQIGMNHWFNTRNSRLCAYVGAAAGGSFATISCERPYSGGVDNQGDPIAATSASSRSGKAWAVTGAAVVGFSYAVAQGLTLGIEVQPFAYTYSALSIEPTGYAKFTATNYEFRAFQMPMLKLGFRF